MQGPFTRPIRIAAATLGALAIALPAAAQLSAPMQGPEVDAPGTFALTPHVTVLDDDGFTAVGPILGTRYGLTDGLSLHGHLGGIFGDLDAFSLGFGGKLGILEQRSDMPVDLSVASTFGLLAGDEATVFTWLAGPLVGHTFDVDPVTLTPYGGFALGVAHRDFDADDGRGPGNDDAEDTELAAGLTLGGEVGIDRDLSLVSELTFGLADGLPDINWGAGVSFRF